MKGFRRRKSEDDGGSAHAAEPDESEIAVLGYRLMVRWWRDRIVVQDPETWLGFVEIRPEVCDRADVSWKTYPDGHAECVLSIRLRIGRPGLPAQLEGSLEIAFPPDREESLRLLVSAINATISMLRNASRPVDVAVPVLPVMPAPVPPVHAERERPRRATKPDEHKQALVSTVAALGMGRTDEERPSAVVPRPEPPRPEPVAPPEPPPRNEPPRLRQLSFVQAPDNADWISFCPLGTADEVRAPVPNLEHG